MSTTIFRKVELSMLRSLASDDALTPGAFRVIAFAFLRCEHTGTPIPLSESFIATGTGLSGKCVRKVRRLLVQRGYLREAGPGVYAIATGSQEGGTVVPGGTSEPEERAGAETGTIGGKKGNERSPNLKKKKETTIGARFVPPSVEEVAAYCLERTNGINPQEFIDYYEARGWIPSGSKRPTSCWRACIRTWEARDRKRQKSATSDDYTATAEEIERLRLASIPEEALA